ncbi:MAG: hypothetical protein GX075_12945 [Firmicutes bacterium]|nr:hypothetical protein [Bacillota bacterium]
MGITKEAKYLIAAGIVFVLTGFTVVLGDAPQLSKAEAASVINRSAAIIRTAQRFAVEGEKYHGLGLSLGHQLYARQLYFEGDYPNAGFHSLRARELAGRVISLNKSSIINEALFNRNEERLIRSSPSGTELDRRLKGREVAIPDDQEAAYADVDLEV